MTTPDQELANASAAIRARVGLKVNAIVSREVGFEWGVEADRYAVRWGDSLATDSDWPFSVAHGQSLGEAVRKALDQIEKQGDEQKRQVENLSARAARLGFQLVRKH